MSRSTHWSSVARLVKDSHRACEEFNLERNEAYECLSAGVQPIVALYIEVRRSAHNHLSPVEQSLLERALNDWLSLYAACHDATFDAHFTVHEMAVAYAAGELETTVDELLDL